MTENVATSNEYIAQRLGPHSKLAGEPYAVELMDAPFNWNDRWIVLYKSYSHQNLRPVSKRLGVETI